MKNWIKKPIETPVTEPPKDEAAESTTEPETEAPAAPPDTFAANVRRVGHVFISYSSKEKVKADSIREHVEKLGYPCWMAPYSLHQRGTQNYGDDIHKAIRECRCLIVALSPKALGSWWIRTEVQYAMADCRKPVIPFIVDPIPVATQDEDRLFIDIRLGEQILNEEGAKNGTMDLSLLNPYLESAFRDASPGASGNALLAAESTQSGDSAMSATQDDWARWRSFASFHLERIMELKAVDPLHAAPTALSPEARREELVLSATEAALSLMRILSSADPMLTRGDEFNPVAVRQDASRDLARLVYNDGDNFGPAVYEMAAQYANTRPWAAFVAQAQHFSPDGRTELKESNQTKARAFLEIAIRDSDNPYACIRMGECWQWGVGGDVSGSQALHWYREALRMGCNDVLFRIAQLYFWASFGIRADWTKAEEYARKGVEANVARCHVLLGDILRDQAEAAAAPAEPDYTAAEEEYAKAYAGGYRDALNRIFDLCYVRNWKPKQPGFEDPDRLLQRAARAGFGGAFDVFVDRTFWGVGETEENTNAAIDYALAGVRQNSSYCGRILAELLVQKAADEEAGSLDTQPIVSFVEKNLELLQDSETQSFLAIFRGKDFPAGVHVNFGKSINLPLSPFWTKLFEEGILPSKVGDESKFSPFRFLEFLQNFQAKRDGDLWRVQRLWRAFRLVGDIRCAVDARQRGLAEVFPSDSLRLDDTQIDEACSVLDDVPKIFPPVEEELAQKIVSIKKLLKSDGGQSGSLAEEKVGKEAQEFETALRRHATKNNRLLHVARILADLEERLSHPFLAASLQLLRNAFLRKSGSLDGSEFGTLFFVLNARYRDPAKNKGVLFAARDALWNVIHEEDSLAVLPFIEVCLFGYRIDDAAIPPDLDSIARIEPVLWELVETEMARSSGSGRRELCVQLAFAMAVIFLDHGLVSAAGKENWGRSSLYSVPKAMEWLSVVLELGGRKDWEDVCPELVKHARRRAEELKAQGYVIVQKYMKKEFLSQLVDVETRAEGRGHQQTCIKELSEQVKSTNLDTMGFSNVVLEGYTIDFVASNDDLAVLFAVLPPDMDFTATEEAEKPEEPPKRTLDCIASDNVISPSLVDLIVKNKEILHHLEEDAEIHLAILASMATINSLRRAWRERLNGLGVKLVTHEFFLDYLQSVFPTLPCSETSDTTS